MNNKSKTKIYFLPILCIAFLTAIDQLTKHIVETKFQLFETKPIIKDVFNFTYIRNEGMAWGMLEGQRILFLIVTVIIMIGCGYIYIRSLKFKQFKSIRGAMVILLSGAIGNLIDRFSKGYVIDFFDFRLINFPIFNVADIYVVVSMLIIGLLIIFKYDNEEIELLFNANKINVKSASDASNYQELNSSKHNISDASKEDETN